jgi:uncharacterized YceG family protein
MTPDDWLSEDLFVDPDDPASVDRARRRAEREERRRGRRAAQQSVPPDPPAAEAPREETVHAGPPRPAPANPTARRSGVPSGLGVAASAALRRPGRILGLAAAAVLLWFLIVLFQPFHGDGSGSVVVKVPKGASVSEVGEILDERGVISSSTLFQIRVTLAGKRSELYPGSYTLAAGMSYGDAIEALSAPPVKRTITATIPEGLSRRQIVPLLRSAGVSGDYLAASERSELLDPAEYGAERAANLEGFLFPATYELPASGTAEQLVERQLDAFAERIGAIDMSYAQSKNLTPYDVLIIASMIEREVQIPKERRLVAAVIYNRLKQDIPLGIDATIRFAVNNYTEPLSPAELETQSPYNTRLYGDLPPGPIGNPGEAAIRAAANPARVDYAYYVVEPYTCGEHVFSSSYAEFERNAAAYQRALEKEGEAPTRC